MYMYNVERIEPYTPDPLHNPLLIISRLFSSIFLKTNVLRNSGDEATMQQIREMRNRIHVHNASDYIVWFLCVI